MRQEYFRTNTKYGQRYIPGLRERRQGTHLTASGDANVRCSLTHELHLARSKTLAAEQ